MQTTSTTSRAAPPRGVPDTLKQCSGCACVYTASEFAGLPSFREWHIEGETLGIAECTGCFSTISVLIASDPHSTETP